MRGVGSGQRPRADNLAGSLADRRAGTNGNPSFRPIPSSPRDLRPACRDCRDSPPGQSPGKVLHRPAASGNRLASLRGPLSVGSAEAVAQPGRHGMKLAQARANRVPGLNWQYNSKGYVGGSASRAAPV